MTALRSRVAFALLLTPFLAALFRMPSEQSAVPGSLPITTRAYFPCITHNQPTVPTPCLCTSNLYNCSDFPTQSAAQSRYDQCNAVEGRRGDIHHLGADNAGLACEELLPTVTLAERSQRHSQLPATAASNSRKSSMTQSDQREAVRGRVLVKTESSAMYLFSSDT